MSVYIMYVASCNECGGTYQTDIEGDANEWDREHEDGNCEFGVG